MAVELNPQQFLKLTQSDFVLVDFWAAWCVPCQKMTPILLACERELPQLKVGRLNVDQYPHLTQKLGVQGLPTLILFKHGEPVSWVTGFQPKDRLLGYLRQNVAL